MKEHDQIFTFLKEAADSGIYRKIVGDDLPAKEFFHFLLHEIPPHEPDLSDEQNDLPRLLIFCTEKGLILACTGTELKTEADSYPQENFPYSPDYTGITINPDALCREHPSVRCKPVAGRYLLLYLPDSAFLIDAFADSLTQLIQISRKSQNLMDCLDYVDNTICIYDKECFLLYANKSYCEHFNIKSREEALGMHIFNITSSAGIQIEAKKTRSNNLKMMDVLKNGRKILDWEIRINPNDAPGNANSIINNMYPYCGADGTVEGLIEISSTQNVNLDQTRKILGMSSVFSFDSIIGESAALTSAKETAKEYALSPYNMLLVGESGVGKEVFAQAVHNESNRRNGPFVAINCASLPDHLIESELFGYVGGAFTGASRNGQAGKFELADGGTIFLDEIGEMPIQFQAKLLRVLETKTVTRIGSSVSKEVDVRVIAATNRNLSEMIREGFFREDLYYRLQVLTVVIPPLRERTEDVLLLAETFLERTTADGAAVPKELSDEAKKILMAHNWPGNVRELRNVIYRLSLLAKGTTITKEDMEEAIQSRDYRISEHEEPETAVPNTSADIEPETDLPPAERIASLRAEIDHSYRTLISEALALSGGAKQKAADLLGVDRKTLYRMIKKYDVENE